MTDEERAQLATYTVRDLLALSKDVRELGLVAPARALIALTEGIAAATGTEIQR
jgi:hypothetical protein